MAMIQIDPATIAERVDARGLVRPMPVLKTAQRLRVLPSGTLVEVLATDPGATRDLAAWSLASGHQVVEQGADGNVLRFVVRRR